MKRALIITYYWPPNSGAGVYRWLKMSKYMSKFGWKPVIYTPLNPTVTKHDASLNKDILSDIEIIKRPIFEPLSIYTNWLSGGKKSNVGTGLLSAEKKSSWKTKLLFWIRGNFFIPDPRRFWVKPSVKFLTKYLSNKPVDVIITTGPPHSMHLIGLKLSRKTGLKWVADFRDPWTDIDFYHQLNLCKIADSSNKRLERKVLQTANLITTVSRNWAADLKALGAKDAHVITNGYDHEEFNKIQAQENDKFTFIHIGSMNNDRNPELLWEALAQAITDIPQIKNKFEILLVGDVDYRVFENINDNGLHPFVKHFPHVAHKKVIELLTNSSLLFLPLNNTPNVMGIIPGKLFEYMAAKKPILAIGPVNGDTAEIIKETNCGEIIGYDDIERMISAINEHIKAFLKGKKIYNASGTDKYSRQNCTEEFCNQLDRLIEE